MRKITELAVRAFINNESFSRDNTCVRIDEDSTTMYLHGNAIAVKTKEGALYVSHCGWCTNTTKERLNGLLDMLGKELIYQKNYTWYLNGEIMEAGPHEL